MKKIGEIITGIAVAAFMISLCTIETHIIGSVITMGISGTWLVCYGWYEEEERRLKEGRY